MNSHRSIGSVRDSVMNTCSMNLSIEERTDETIVYTDPLTPFEQDMLKRSLSMDGWTVVDVTDDGRPRLEVK